MNAVSIGLGIAALLFVLACADAIDQWGARDDQLKTQEVRK